MERYSRSESCALVTKLQLLNRRMKKVFSCSDWLFECDASRFVYLLCAVCCRSALGFAEPVTPVG